MDYDLIIIGGGPAGYTAAFKAAQSGLKTALIESRQIGGTCLNRGCIPTKTLLHTSAVYTDIKNSRELGIRCSAPVLDMTEVFRHKDQIVAQLIKGLELLIKNHKIAYFQQTAAFVNEHTLRLMPGDEAITAERIIIATGCQPSRLPIPGLDSAYVYTSDDVLHEPLNGETIVIIGGGVIGCELAAFYRECDRKVTIIEVQDRLLANIDPELSRNLQQVFRRQGIELLLKARLKEVTIADHKATCHYLIDDQAAAVTADAIILSIGRRPATEALNLTAAGVNTDRRGYIPVDQHYVTNIPHIFAIGDVNGGIQLAHVAAEQAEQCLNRILDETYQIPAKTIPYCIYTHPEIAYAGIDETTAKEQGLDYQASKFIMSANGKYLIESRERGYIKVIFVKGIIAGAQLFMDKATEYLAFFTTAIDQQLTYEQLTGTIFPHPTVSEGIRDAIRENQRKAAFNPPIKR